MSKKKNKSFRIAMLGHKRIPSREGGVEIVVTNLAARMAEMGYDVTCFNRKGHHVSGADFDEAELTEYEGVKLKSVFTLDKKGLAAMTSSFFAAIKASIGKFDVVHFHAEGPCAMLWLPKLFGKRCIATIHGLDHQRAKWGKFAAFYILFGEKCAARFADEIIVLSENVQQYFMEKYSRKTVFIPNGVCKADIVPPHEIVEKFELEKDSYILYLGRLVPEKGIAYLIEAFKMLDTDKKLVIAGGASDSTEYAEQLKKLAADDSRIIFTDFVQGRLLEELYSNAYLYVLPSDLEGMPLSLLEAMSYKCCCLVSDIAENATVVADYGVTFRKGDIEDLSKKLQSLISDSSKVKEYGEKSCEYVCDKYNWDDVTEKTLELYYGE